MYRYHFVVSEGGVIEANEVLETQRESFHMMNGPEQEARDKLFLSQLETSLTGEAFPSRW